MIPITDKLENPSLPKEADFLLRLPVEPTDPSALTHAPVVWFKAWPSVFNEQKTNQWAVFPQFLMFLG